eukprot:INCI18217.1.p1 GENE.INCI18217.1~~INCI18217.1.p1  ORF type:complete len:477 (-),score=75.26 INCI18217.1:508-1938(-)
MSEQRCRQDMNYRRCGRCEWTFAHCDLPTETQEILQETLDSAWRTCCDVGAKTKIPAYENLGSAPALVPTSALKLLFKRHLVPSSKALSHSSHSTNEDHSDVDVPARAETAERPKEAITLPRHPQLDSFVKQLSKLRKSESKIKKKRGGVGGRSSSKKCPAAAVVSILLQCATDGTLDQLVQSLVVEEKNAPENGGSTAAASSAGSSMPQEKRARIVDDSKKSKKQKRKLLPISWIESDTLANMCETFFSMGSGDSAASTTGVSVSSRDSGTFLSVFVLPFVSQLRQPMPRELFACLTTISKRHPAAVVQALLVPVLLPPASTATSANAESVTPPASSVGAAHTEFIKRLCVDQSGRDPSIPPALSAELLLRVLGSGSNSCWNEEVLGLAQTLLDTGLPLSPDQFSNIVSSVAAAVHRGGGGRWTASLKFAAVLFALVRKYAPSIRDGGHKATLAKVLGQCTNFLAKTAAGALQRV